MIRTISYKDELLESLKDPEEAAAYLLAAYEDDDPEVFALAIQDVIEARQKYAPEGGVDSDLERLLGQSSILCELKPALKKAGLTLAVNPA